MWSSLRNRKSVVLDVSIDRVSLAGSLLPIQLMMRTSEWRLRDLLLAFGEQEELEAVKQNVSHKIMAKQLGPRNVTAQAR